jgi:predicted RNA binding protein with dsRBD fold (UPF0201 family)
MAEITVHVETEINPTESIEKVKTAVLNIFDNLSIRIEPQQIGNTLIAEAKTQASLMNFQAALRRDRVRAAARKLLHARVKGNTISFYLNKQVAFAGHISFSQETGECPLGPIKAVIETENPRELIDWLAPRIA